MGTKASVKAESRVLAVAEGTTSKVLTLFTPPPAVQFATKRPQRRASPSLPAAPSQLFYRLFLAPKFGAPIARYLSASSPCLLKRSVWNTRDNIYSMHQGVSSRGAERKLFLSSKRMFKCESTQKPTASIDTFSSLAFMQRKAATLRSATRHPKTKRKPNAPSALKMSGRTALRPEGFPAFLLQE